jgi:endonuclease G, mitochondrial
MATPGEIEAARDEQARRAVARYEETQAEREANEQLRRAEGLAVLDTEQQLEARASRLARRGQIPVEAMLEVARTDVVDRRAVLERIIGATKDFQAASFLPRGVRAAATVARISYLDDGRELPLRTGFLVSPRLLMTNNHPA